MKRIYLLRLIQPLCIHISATASAQSTKEDKKKAKQEQLKAQIDARQFTFNAQSATSTGGRTRQLTGSNTLVIHGDSLDAYLPYFGRAYSATPGDTNGGINFSSTSFSYDAQDAKNGGWIIVIKPENEKSASNMQLSISEDGYATLQVTSNNRQMISFYGQVSGNSKNK
jgi:hypothetical protein